MKRKKRSHVLILIGAILVLLTIVAAELVFLFFLSGQPFKNKLSFAQYADRIIAKCASDSYHPACYDREIPKLMDSISMEDAFSVTRLIQEKDKSYFYCHVLGHGLAAREVAKDPSKWKEVIVRAPTGMCSNGAIHGAFQERFRSESFSDDQIQKLKGDLVDICEAKPNWNPTGMVQASCYHALGHLMMYITRGDVNKSINLCGQTIRKDLIATYSQLCFDGTFMQIFQPLEPEDFAIVAGKAPTIENLTAYCGQFAPIQKDSCWTEAWPLSRDQIKNPAWLETYCAHAVDSVQRDRCFSAMFYVLTPMMDYNPDQVKNFCGSLSGLRQPQCFADAASRTIETDSSLIAKAVSICSAAKVLAMDERCWQELVKFSTFNFHAGSQEFYNLCNSLPDKWRVSCLRASGPQPAPAQNTADEVFAR